LAAALLVSFAITGEICYRASLARKFWSFEAAEDRKKKKQRVTLTYVN